LCRQSAELVTLCRGVCGTTKAEKHIYSNAMHLTKKTQFTKLIAYVV